MLAGDDAAGREPNRLLSAARHAHRLTQQQLAEAVGAAHWRLFSQEAAIDADHVSKLERGLITWPNSRYREAFRAVLAGHLRWAAGLLRGRADGPTRRELHSTVGFFADAAAWSYVDAGDHETALICFRLALYCAEEAADWSLRAEVLTDMSRQAVDRGHLDDAISLIELAQVRADRVGGTGRAMMSSVHARVLGAAGRVADCRNAIKVAEDHFAAHQPIGELSGSSFFQRANETDLLYDNSSALFHAGLHDFTVVPAVIGQLRAALDHSGTVSRRRRATSTVKLATLELAHGDRDEGIALTHQALDLGGGLRSARLVDDLRRLRTATTRHTSAPVDALRQQLDSVLMS